MNRILSYYRLILQIPILLTATLFIAEAETPGFLPDEIFTYKEVDGIALDLYAYYPEEHTSTDTRPVILFFFGGGWVQGDQTSFAPFADYFASRGIVALTADYRITKVHQSSPYESVKDARSAIRWVRANASNLGIDPDKVIASGGSAGGHLAACTAVLPESSFVESTDDTNLLSKPNAVILFNAVIDNSPAGYGNQYFGEDYLDISPYFQANATVPPLLHLSGELDTLITPSVVEDFHEQLISLGVDSHYYIFPGADHGFYNYGRADYVEAVERADTFLSELGYLSGDSTIASYAPTPYSLVQSYAAEEQVLTNCTTVTSELADHGAYISTTADSTLTLAHEGLHEGLYHIDTIYYDTALATYELYIDGLLQDSWSSSHSSALISQASKRLQRSPLIKVEHNSSIELHIQYQSGTYAATDTIVLNQAFLIETEDLENLNTTFDSTFGAAYASGNGFTSFNTSGSREIEFWQSFNGVYDIYIDFFKESGETNSTLTVEPYSTTITVPLLANSDSHLITERMTIPNVFLTEGDLITLTASLQDTQVLPIDRIIFSPSTSINRYYSGSQLIAHWEMNDESPILSDLSGNNFSALLSGGSWVAGKGGHAITLDGLDDYITLPSEAFAQIDDTISLSIWVKGDSNSQPRADTLLKCRDAAATHVMQLYLPHSNGRVIWDVGSVGGVYNRTSKLSTEAYDDTWHHWVFTKDTTLGSMQVYLDGQLWDEKSAQTLPISTITTAYLGCAAPSSGNFVGTVDDFRIFNYILSASEVAELYDEFVCYDTWERTENLTVKRTPLLDDDADGRLNVMEYILNSSNDEKNFEPEISYTIDGDTTTVCYQRSSASIHDTLQYIEYGTDMENWTSTLIDSENTDVELTIPSISPQLFIRLSATLR